MDSSRIGVRFPTEGKEFFLHNVQISFGAHLASYSLSLYSYQKDVGAKPGNLPTKRCIFPLPTIKCLLIFPGIFTFAYSSIPSTPLSLS
jgi:hypothetical protein